MQYVTVDVPAWVQQFAPPQHPSFNKMVALAFFNMGTQSVS
jgi:hypothetical protein